MEKNDKRRGNLGPGEKIEGTKLRKRSVLHLLIQPAGRRPPGRLRRLRKEAHVQKGSGGGGGGRNSVGRKVENQRGESKNVGDHCQLQLVEGFLIVFGYNQGLGGSTTRPKAGGGEDLSATPVKERSRRIENRSEEVRSQGLGRGRGRFNRSSLGINSCPVSGTEASERDH